MAAALAAPTEERAGKIADISRPAIGSCAAISRVFDDVATTTSDLRGKTLFDGLPAAIEQCKCEGIDVDTLVAAVWATGGKTQPSTRGLLLPLSREPGVEAVALPAAATTRDLIQIAEARGGKPFQVTRAP